jgi:O-antigen ligase
MALLYVKHGGISAVDASVQGGRATFDAETLYEDAPINENYTALAMLCYIPVLLVSLFQTVRTQKEKLLKILSFALLGFTVLVLVRTGSRNGTVGFLPSLWYCLFSTTNRMKRRKRLFLLVLATIIFVPVVSYTMRGADKLRIFDFSTESDSRNVSKENVLTSGRFEIWSMHVEEMDVVDRLVGRGFRRKDLNRLGRVSVGNAHCAYMTVFYNSGFVGIILLLCFMIASVSLGFKLRDRGRIALLFIGTWFMSGVAESLPIQGGVSGVLAGFGMGLLCRNPTNSELMTDQERQRAFGWWIPFGRP